MAVIPKDAALYLRVLENMEEAVIAIDGHGKIVLYNPSAQICTGLSEKQAIGKFYQTLFKKQTKLLELVAKALEKSRSLFSHEDLMLERPTGAPLPVRVSLSPNFDQNGNPDGVILMLRDLTQVRELQEAIHRSETLSMLGTLAAGLAHEIKNPLGGIKGAAQLLNMELPPESSLKEYTSVMTREVDRVNDIIEELLDLERPPSPRLGAVNLGRLLSDIVLLQKESQRPKQVDFQLLLDPSIPAIRADEKMLVRLFLNLIKNAAEAVEQGGQVKICSRIASQFRYNKPGEKPVPLVVIEVKDNGSGITPEQMEHMFTPFYTTKDRGTGLGLAICQKIVSDHGGFLKVESQPGEGTQFAVSLPMLRPKNNQVPTPS